MRGANKFRYDGIEPSLYAKYDIMFSNIVAMRQYIWTPSQRLLSEEGNGAAGMRNTTNDETNIKEESGDSKEDVIHDFVHDVSNMVGESNVTNSSSNHSSAKKEVNIILHLNAEKKRWELEWKHNYSHV